MPLVIDGHHLSASSIGQKVIYTPTGERGVISSLGERLIFVRFLGDTTSKGCNGRDLTWVSYTLRNGCWIEV